MTIPAIRKVADAAISWAQKSWPVSGATVLVDGRPVRQPEPDPERRVVVSSAYVLDAYPERPPVNSLPPDDPTRLRAMFGIEVDDE